MRSETPNVQHQPRHSEFRRGLFRLSRDRSWIVNLTLLVLSLGVTLLLLELGARFFVTFVKPNVMILDSELGWRHRPDASRVYQVEGHAARVETNELGFRGALYYGPSPNTRVLILGDSFGDGLEVSNTELFSVLLDKLRPDLEIVNASVGGYGTVQQLLTLRRLVSTIEPEIVILMVYINDLTDNVMPFYGGIGPRPYMSETGTMHELNWDAFEPLLLPLPANRWIHQHSIAAYLIRNRVWLPFRKSSVSSYITEWRTAISEEVKWVIFESLVHQLQRIKPLIIIAVPPKENIASEDYGFSVRLQALAEKMTINFIALHPALKIEHFYSTDIHWNENGHAVVAQYLSENLMID